VKSFQRDIFITLVILCFIIEGMKGTWIAVLLVISISIASAPFVYAAVGDFVTKFGSGGSGDGEFSSPKGVAVDSSNRIIVVDAGGR